MPGAPSVRPGGVAASEAQQKLEELHNTINADLDKSRRELSEMEARLRRLEQHQTGEETRGFSGGLRKLEQGTRPQRGS